MDIFAGNKLKKSTNKPLLLPNLALRGNRAVNYSLNKSSSVDTDGKELSVPSLPYASKFEERKMANLIMFANKHYRFDRYVGIEHPQILQLAKVIAGGFNARLLYRKLQLPSRFKVSRKEAQSYYAREEIMKFRSYAQDAFNKARIDNQKLLENLREENKMKASDKFYDVLDIWKDLIDDKEVINYLTYKAMETNIYPIVDGRYLSMVVQNAVDMYYNTKNPMATAMYIVEQVAVVSSEYYRSAFYDEIEAAVRRNIPFGMDEEVIKGDMSFFNEFISTVLSTCSQAKRLPEGAKGYQKFHRWDNSAKGWKSREKIINKPKGLVRKIYNQLTFDSYWQQERVARFDARYLPSEIAHEMKETMEGGIKLPDHLSDELKEEIMEEGNNNHNYRFNHRAEYGGVGKHGKALIRKFKPNIRIQKAIREIQKRNSDIGVVPKNMHRMTIDRKVFSSRKSVAGGSMMIDFSGSMGWSDDEVREIIDLLPASTIAGYVGYNNLIDGYDGRINIIAENGKMDSTAINDLLQWGANSVDLDALKWLAKQPEPRIWVSDQAVYGVDERGYNRELPYQSKLEILRFMQTHNIIPIESYDTVYKVAKQLATNVKRKR